MAPPTNTARVDNNNKEEDDDPDHHNNNGERIKDFIDSQVEQAGRKVAGAWTLVALLGAGGTGLEERRSVARELTRIGIGALLPEDDLPEELAPSLLERNVLSQADVDLVFVNVQSWGSATEFTELRSDPSLARKLRVLVPRRYHPIYGSPSSCSGYLADTYMTHEAVYGHVYMYMVESETEPDWLPTPGEIVLRIAERYRQWKALG